MWLTRFLVSDLLLLMMAIGIANAMHNIIHTMSLDRCRCGWGTDRRLQH